MDNIKKLADTILKAIKKESQSKSYFTQAEVIKTDGNIAWVHIPNGVDMTPVKKTINCKKGDTVQIRVGEGSATITGNQTTPPTDDTKAIKATEKAQKAQASANHAQETANEAKEMLVTASVIGESESIEAGDTTYILLLIPDIPEGYQVIGVLEIGNTNALNSGVVVTSYSARGNTVGLYAYNAGNTQSIFTPYATVLCMRR